MNFNKVLLAGNLTRDPELKYLPNGTAACQFSIASNRKWKDANGQAQEDVYFADCKSFGKTAEVITQYHKKGNSIFVEGRLQREEWEDKTTGARKTATRIVVESFQFVGGKKEDPQHARQRPGPEDIPPHISKETDNDIPF